MTERIALIHGEGTDPLDLLSALVVVLAAEGGQVTRIAYDPNRPEAFDCAGLLQGSFDRMVLCQVDALISVLCSLYDGPMVIVPAVTTPLQEVPEIWGTYAGNVFISFDTGLHHRLTGLGCESLLARPYPAPRTRVWLDDAPLSASCVDTGRDMLATLKRCEHWGVTELHVAMSPRLPGGRRAALTSLQTAEAPHVALRFTEAGDDPETLLAHPLCFAPRGTGIEVLNAMAHGQVVVGVAESFMQGYIADGYNGLLLRPQQAPYFEGAALRDRLPAMAAAAIATITAGRADWLDDLDRIGPALRGAGTAHRHDAGSAFDWAIRLAAGARRTAGAL